MWLEIVTQICSRILEIASQRIKKFKIFPGEHALSLLEGRVSFASRHS